MNLKNIKTGTKLIGGLLLIELLFLAALVPVYLLLRKSQSLTNEIHVNTYKVLNKSMDLKINVIQVQQWLTDISATRGAPGFDDGFDEAEKHVKLFKELLGEISSLVPAMSEETTLISSDFDEYYLIGKQMAETYIDEGPDAGNFFMEKFDPYAIRINEKIDALVEAAEENIDVSFNDAERNVSTSITMLIFVFLISLAAGLVITILITRGIVIPVKKIVAHAKELAEGDYTNDIPDTLCRRGDELGDLSRVFDLLIGNTRRLILSIKEQAAFLSSLGIELSSNMNETAASINQISASIKSIKNQAINQAASVTETNSTMEQITQNIRMLDTHIDQQAVNVTQSSSAIEEMVSNIHSVTSSLEKNAEIMEELTQASTSGRTNLTVVSSDIRDVAKESEGLLEISSVIQSIAGQTNLLSMNAAIEAAHAGDSGKGFAVVAGEIRKLAESSGSQSKTISASLKKIKEAMDRITLSTDTVLQQFEDIDRKIEMVNQREQEIRSAMVEQGSGSTEILGSVGKLNEITYQVKSGSSEMLHGSQEIIRESTNLGTITQEVTGSMNEMAAGAEQIAIAVNRVNDISRSTKDSIDALGLELARFKIQ